MLRRNCFIKHVTEGKIEGRTEVTVRRGRWCKQLLDDLKETSGCCKLKEEALDRTQWRTRLGRDYGLVVKTDYRMNLINPAEKRWGTVAVCLPTSDGTRSVNALKPQVSKTWPNTCVRLKAVITLNEAPSVWLCVCESISGDTQLAPC
jgi:hypothetical protein